MKTRPYFHLLYAGLIFVSFSLSAQRLIDKQATPETRALYQNMYRLSGKGFMFGHHDADAYGVLWKEEAGRSDVKDVCGSHPAVHGFDLGAIGKASNIDNVSFENMRQWVIGAYQRGGLSTLSWHYDNPVSGGNSWDKTPAVKDILPGGPAHEKFVKALSQVADFLASCRVQDTAVPLIFRPWHEHNGDWFWWGKGFCTEAEYIQLWKFTVDYLKNTRQLHHIIYAFSPDRSRLDMSQPTSSYLYGYPGDAYVDIIGLDNYMDVGATWNKRTPEEQAKGFVASITMVDALARAKHKVAALTETGLEGVTRPDWFTQVILEPLVKAKVHIAYVLVWRNANTQHHYAPYLGHPSAPDFIRFYQSGHTFFENDLQNLYVTRKPLLR